MERILFFLLTTLLAVSTSNNTLESSSVMMIDNYCSGPGAVYRLKVQHSNKYLQVQNRSTANGANIEQWSSNSNNYQRFYFDHVSGDQYRIINKNTNKSIGIANGSTANGANAQQQNLSSSSSQLFRFDSVGNGVYHIINVNSNKALNISGNSTSNGGNLIQWPVGSGTNDNFTFELVSGSCNTIECEAKIGNSAWQVLSNCQTSANAGQSVILSTNPNQATTWTLPDGSTYSGNDLTISNAQAANKGWYYAEMNINGAVMGKSIYLNVVGDNNEIGILTQYNTGKAVSSVIMHNNYLFVPLGADHGGGQGDGAFAFYDISNPNTVTPVFRSLDYPNTYHNSNNQNYVGDLAEIHSLPVIRDGNYMVLSERRNGSAGFSIMNVTGFPSQQPQIVSRFSFPGVTSPSNYDGYSFSLACQGSKYVFAPTGSNGLFIVDISNPQNPTLVRHMTQSELGNQILRAAVVIGDLLILTPGAVGVNQPVMFLDITDAANPSIINTTQNIPIGYQPFVYGSELFGAADGNIVGYDFSDPSNITTTTYNTVAANYLTNPEYGFGQDGHLFIGHYPGLTKWNKSAATNAGPVVTLSPTNPSSDDYAFLTPVGNLAIIASDHNHSNKLNIGRHKAGMDTTPPAAEFVWPKDQSTNVNVNASIGINFSDFVDALTMNAQSIEVKNTVNNSTVAGSFNQMFGVVNFVPSAALANNTTYEIRLKQGGIKDWRGNAISQDTLICTFSTGNQISVNPPFTIDSTSPKATGETVSLSINHTVNVNYAWNFGDGSAVVNTTSHNVSHQYANAGNYTVSVTATYANGTSSTQSTVQVVHKPLLANRPLNSSSIILDESNNKVWNVNPDNNSVTAINTANNTKQHEVAVGNQPQTLALVSGKIWVANKKDATISILNASNAAIEQTINLPKRSQPHGIVYNSAQNKVYVSLEAKGQLIAIDANTKQITNTLSVATHIRDIAFHPANNKVYISQFISPTDGGKVHVVNTNNFSLESPVSLAISAEPDGQFNGRGLPNYLGALSISPDGSQLFVPSKKDNIQRGTFRDGQALTFEHTVRSMGASIDLSNNTEQSSNRVDFDNSDFATSATYNAYGNKILATTSGSSLIWVVDAYTGNREGSFNSSGLAPRGITISNDGSRLYVHNFMERNVAIFDATVCVINCGNINLIGTVSTVASESLNAQVLLGKKLFYNSADLRLSQDNYMSCASCHLDGSSDGMVWDMTSFGEGLRNTIDLRGKGTLHGRAHWTGNFDEIQDFENQIRNLNNGSGFLTAAQFANTEDPLGNPKAGLSSDLDAIAAYIASLTDSPESPHKQENGQLTAAAQNGLQIFNNKQCYSCHGGSTFTNSAENYLVDVGTISSGSGKRANATLRGFDVPTLKGLWATAPYLHDGSAATLMDVLTTKNPQGKHADLSDLSSNQLNDLVAYLQQIDDNTSPANAATLQAIIATPTNGQQLGINKPINLSTTVSMNNISSIEYFVNNTSVGTASSTPFSLSYTTTTMGNNTIYAKVTFGNGTIVHTQDSSFEVFTIAPHCQDGVQNADETGVDCGGTDCNPCPTCNDGVMNGDEVGVDCGGSNCDPCPCASGDSDGDGICNGTDLDDDNDGILNTQECVNTYLNQSFSNGNGGGVHNYSRAYTNEIVIDFTTLDNSAQIRINGSNIDKVFETERTAFNSSTDVIIKFSDGDYIAPWVANSNGLPRLRVKINSSGAITLQGTRSNTSTSLSNVIRESSTALPTINFGNNTSVRIENMNDSGPDGITGTISMKGNCDTDADGILNHLDLDSDNDGCVDALEGSATITFAQLQNASSNLSVGNGSSADNKNLGTTVNAQGVPTIVGNGQTAGTAYNASNKSSDCFPPDEQAPSAPTNLAVSNITQNSFNLSWTAASDNVAVSGYKVYLNGNYNKTVTSTNTIMSGLNASTAYTAYVRAIDAANNESTNSNTVNATTLDAPSCATIRVEIKTDNYANETNWTLKNSSNQTVMSGGNYSNNNTVFNKQECLPQGCYTFRITDSYGDGICCSYGSGYYKIYVDGNLVQQGGNFNSAETKQICTTNQSMLAQNDPSQLSEDIQLEELTIYPVPANLSLNAKGALGADFVILDINGRKVKEGKMLRRTIDISELHTGIYLIQFSKENEIVTRRFMKE